MPNSYPSDGIFISHRRTIMDSFSCMLFLRQSHLDLNMCCFINLTLKYLHFSIKKSSVRLLPYTLTSKRLAETDVKMTWRRKKWRQNVKIIILTSCTRVVLHPPPNVRQHFPGPVGFTNIAVGYARIKCCIWAISWRNLSASLYYMKTVWRRIRRRIGVVGSRMFRLWA